MKKVISLSLLCAFMFSSVGVAFGATSNNSALIESLRAEIAELRAELLRQGGSVTVFKEGLVKGDVAEDVSRIQETLAQDEATYPAGLVTGYFGQLTEVAISNFQIRHGLPITGTLTKETQYLIERYYCAKNPTYSKCSIFAFAKGKIVYLGASGNDRSIAISENNSSIAATERDTKNTATDDRLNGGTSGSSKDTKNTATDDRLNGGTSGSSRDTKNTATDDRLNGGVGKTVSGTDVFSWGGWGMNLGVVGDMVGALSTNTSIGLGVVGAVLGGPVGLAIGLGIGGFIGMSSKRDGDLAPVTDAVAISVADMLAAESATDLADAIEAAAQEGITGSTVGISGGTTDTDSSGDRSNTAGDDRDNGGTDSTGDGNDGMGSGDSDGGSDE